MKRGSWILKMVVLGALAIGIFGLTTQLLWNWLVPILFNGPVITFWQALGLIVLSKILLWPFGKRHNGHRGGAWRPYWKEKWSKMTPEQKESFKQRMREKCGWGSPLEPEKSTAQDKN